MGNLSFERPCHITSDLIASAFRSIFADGEVPPPESFDAFAFERRFAFEHLDRVASWLVLDAGTPAGVMLVARRGTTSHISGLGVARAHRRAGIATQLLQIALSEARARGDRRIVVEVSTRNGAALRLYGKHGFTAKRRLVGFVCSAPSQRPVENIREIDPLHVASRLFSAPTADLPWFFHPASLAGSALPTRGYALDGHAFAVVTFRRPELRIRALFVEDDARRRGLGTALVQGLMSQHAAERCVVQPFVPEGLCDDFFAAIGFAQTPVANHELEVALSSVDAPNP